MATTKSLSDYTDEPDTEQTFELGAVVREDVDPETEEADPMVVVGHPEAPAGEYEVDPLAGTTICGHASTPDSVSESEAVFEVVFVETLLYYDDQLPDGCTPTTAHEYLEEIEESPATVYAYPESRLSND